MKKLVQLLDHYSPETAFTVYKYPFLFGQYCNIRYWVGTNANFGQKLYHQVQNLVTGEWCNPKDASNGFKDIIILQQITSTEPESSLTHKDTLFYECGHVKPLIMDLNNLSNEHIAHFAGYYVFSEYQKDKIIKHIKNLSNIDPESILSKIVWKDNSILKEPFKTTKQHSTNPRGRPKFNQEQRQRSAIVKSSKYKESSPFNVSNFETPEKVKAYIYNQIVQFKQPIEDYAKKFPEFFEPEEDQTKPENKLYLMLQDPSNIPQLIEIEVDPYDKLS